MSTLTSRISRIYPVTFNYDRPYDELIGVEPRKFSKVSNCFTPEHFPIIGSGIVTAHLRYLEFN
ncbi:MAG TPA: hypothetical protein VLG69_01070, partial [Candidatus Andersenbacteria bacterium]|nr:hypothetical protein [Candidatus Andersenbacteria bacterium]